MSEDESRRAGQQDEPQDEVEAHGTRHPHANDEGTGEGEENDVEGHIHQRRGNLPRKQ